MGFFFIFVTFCVISFHSEEAVSINIQCWFYHDNFGYGTKNGCYVLSVTLSSSEDREIASVNGDDGKTYYDVWWFWSSSKNFNHFPKNIKKIFPNVEGFSISNADIAILTKSHMASLGSQLRKIYFYQNSIEVLEEGLFDENPNLEHIDLDGNQIKFVASGVFDKLSKLKTLHFSNNPCHSGSAVNDRAAVLTLIRKIEEKCQDSQAYEKFRNLFTTTSTEKVKTEHELRIEELTAEVAELKQLQLASDKRYKEELQKHKAEASLKDEQITELKEENEGFKQDLAATKPCDELHEVRDSLMSKFKELEAKFDYKLDLLECIRQP